MFILNFCQSLSEHRMTYLGGLLTISQYGPYFSSLTTQFRFCPHIMVANDKKVIKMWRRAEGMQATIFHLQAFLAGGHAFASVKLSWNCKMTHTITSGELLGQLPGFPKHNPMSISQWLRSNAGDSYLLPWVLEAYSMYLLPAKIQEIMTPKIFSVVLYVSFFNLHS